MTVCLNDRSTKIDMSRKRFKTGPITLEHLCVPCCTSLEPRGKRKHICESFHRCRVSSWLCRTSERNKGRLPERKPLRGSSLELRSGWPFDQHKEENKRKKEEESKGEEWGLYKDSFNTRKSNKMFQLESPLRRFVRFPYSMKKRIKSGNLKFWLLDI